MPSDKQRASIHIAMRVFAYVMNKGGFSVNECLRRQLLTIDVEWNSQNFISNIIEPIVKSLFDVTDYKSLTNDQKTELLSTLQTSMDRMFKVVSTTTTLSDAIKHYPDLLNDAGLYINDFISTGVIKGDVWWSEESYKQVFGRKVLSVMYPEKTSFEQLDKTEVTKLFDALNANMARLFGISIEYPNKDNMNEKIQLN